MSKHIWVLGGSGFLGRAVIKELTQRGHRVSGLYRKTILPEGVKAVSGNISSFPWATLEEDMPDAIIHLARIPGRRKISRFLAGLRGKRASNRLLGWIRSLANPPHIIFVSGTLVYGNQFGGIATEDTPLNPIAFQRDYFKAEMPFLEMLESKTLPVSIVRPPWIIGPGSWFSQFYYTSAKKSGSITQFGDGKNLMSLIHVQDCASQIVDITEQSDFGQVYNLCSCPPISHEQFLQLTARETGAKIELMSSIDLRKKYGKTVWEALTFSRHVKSTKSAVLEHTNSYPLAEEAIKSVVAMLDSERTNT